MIFFKIFFLLLKFLIEEIKLLKTEIVNFFIFFKEYNVLNILFRIFFSKKKLNIFKINQINKFISLNYKNINPIIGKNSKKIFVESFINHPIYTIQNCIIAANTSKILNLKCCGILRKGDLKSKEILNSFGINEVVYIDKGNPFSRFVYLIKAFNLLYNLKNLESLIKLKIDDIEIGRSTYDQYLRFKKNPAVKSIVLDFYFMLSQALHYNYQFKNLFYKNKNTYLIQSETQYFPLSLCLMNAIKFGNRIISRRGEVAKIGLKIFSKNKNNYKENRNRPSIEAFNLVERNLKKNKIQIKNKKKYFNLNIGKEIFQNIQKNESNKIYKSKKHVYEYFNFDKKKPIVLILAHELSDGNMNNSWNLFNNDLIWLEETLKKISGINNVNWIIKPHPSENVFNNKIKTKNIFNRLIKDKKNISLFPDTYNIKNFYKYISAAVSSHGSAGFEYPLKSIPTILCGESTCSGFGFNIEPKTKKNYFNILKKIHKIKKLNNNKIFKCFIFNYLIKYISLEHVPVSFETDITMDFDKQKFWRKTYNLSKKKGIFYKPFYDSLKFQLINDNSYYINLNKLKKLNFSNKK